jgi:hypothetical protein
MMEHSSWIQLRSLLKKNATMTVRKRKDICRECFLPIFMLGVLIFLRAQFKTVDFPARLNFPAHSLDLTSGTAAYFSLAAIEELKAKPEIGVAPCPSRDVSEVTIITLCFDYLVLHLGTRPQDFL